MKDDLRHLARRLAGADEHMDIAGAALELARLAYPQLDISACVQRIDELADRVRDHYLLASDPFDKIEAINAVLFREEGFVGNLAAYDDPRNSYLNQVLERRLGIPVSLSILYIAVGRRIGLDLKGVAFPGHFLVALELGAERVLLDPFFAGVEVGRLELEQRLQQLYGQKAEQLRRFIDDPPLVDNRGMLVRMLKNLQRLYEKKEEWPRLLAVLERLMLLCPEEAMLWRTRGELFARLECPHAAVADLQAYLERSPRAPDAERVRTLLERQKRGLSRLH